MTTMSLAYNVCMHTEMTPNIVPHAELPSEYGLYQTRASEKLTCLLQQYWSAVHPRTQRLHDAIAYAIQSGGKRLRPILVYATGLALSTPIQQLDAAACAIELIHTYSLVHDDLPAMDDDDFRRDKPTCHKAFEEATAILVGDALQTMAFEVLSDAGLNPLAAEQRLTQIQALSKASGVQGMIGGQMLDIMSEGDLSVDETTLQTMYHCKTGALIRVSVELALIATPSLTPHIKTSLLRFADIIGLAFQVKDDLLDLDASVDKYGRTIISSDIQQDKMTFPRLLGVKKTQAKLQQLLIAADNILEPLGTIGDRLRPIAHFCVIRKS